MDEQEKALEPVITCDVCNEYQGTKRQVNMHKLHCKGSTANIDIEDLKQIEEPDKTPAPREREKADRRERIPLGVIQQKLPQVPENDGFQYRVINDNWQKDPARVLRAQRGGYEIVEGVDKMSVGVNDDGTAIQGVLMRIPKKWYEEDQHTKRESLRNIEESIRKGTVDQQPGDKRYSPQGIGIHSSHDERG